MKTDDKKYLELLKGGEKIFSLKEVKEHVLIYIPYFLKKTMLQDDYNKMFKAIDLFSYIPY